MDNRLIKTSALVFTALFILSGCGGSSSSAGPAPTPTPTPTPPAGLTLNDVAGFYSGEVTSGENTIFVDALISSTGEIRVVTELDEQLTGNITLSNNGFSDVEFLSFFPENSSDSGVILGRLNTKGSLTGEFSSTELIGSGSFDGINTSYSLTKEEFSSNGASFDDFSGNYASLSDDAQISFDSDGVINGLDTDGCLYGGQVSIPDSNTNIYSLSITVDNCDVFNGTFDGLATLVPAGSIEDIDVNAILLNADDGAFSLTVALLEI